MDDTTEGSATVLDDRWVEFREVEGWEGFVIRVQARLHRGEAQATGVTVLPVDPGSREGLTSQRLRRLPVLRLAREALAYLPAEPAELTESRPAHELLAELTPEQRERLAQDVGLKLTEQQTGVPHRPRAAVQLDRFVEAWRAAMSDPGRSTGVREAVCRHLQISTRTYDRYRKQAEAVPGLMSNREENPS